MRSGHSARISGAFARVLRAVALAGPASHQSKFTGSRIGRGAGATVETLAGSPSIGSWRGQLSVTRRSSRRREGGALGCHLVLGQAAQYRAWQQHPLDKNVLLKNHLFAILAAEALENLARVLGPVLPGHRLDDGRCS
jgi:hypothetical protein